MKDSINPKILLGTTKSKGYQELLNVVDTAVANGCYAFDTAPSYKCESDLGRAIKETSEKYNIDRSNFHIVDKIDAWQMQDSNGKIEPYVIQVLKDMNLDYFDTLLVHWPIPEYINNTWKEFERLYEDGIARRIGIANVKERHLLKYMDYRIPPQVIQIERHPLHTCDSEVNFCKKNGIDIQAYSPLCKMDPRFVESAIIGEIAKKYNKNIGQIILRWHIDTGVSPVFMSKKSTRIIDYLNIFDFSLTSDDINIIQSMNINYKLIVESCGCPGF